MTALTRFFKSGPRGTPATSEGSSAAHFMHAEWAVQLECETWSTTQARTGDPLRVRQTLDRHSAHVRCGLHSQDVASRTTRPTYNGVTSEDLTDRCRPTAARTGCLDKAAEHNGTIRWPLLHNLSKVVLAGHRQAQMDHQQCVELVHAKTICMTKTWDMVRRTNTCETAHMVNT